MVNLANQENRAARVKWFLVALTLILSVCAMGPRVPDPETKLNTLLAERRYFELRRILESGRVTDRLENLYLRGRVANAFNQINASIDDLTSYLQAAGAGLPENRLRDVLGVLADDYAKSFQYAKAAETREKMLPLLKESLPAPTFADFRGSTLLWKALGAYPPQSVAVLEDTEISPVEGAGVPAAFGALTVPLLPDTGSDFSVIGLSDAERLGLSMLDVPVDISTATGARVSARAAVAAEMRIGRIIVRNAVFLVVPEEMLYFPDIKKKRFGLLGFPVLAGMGEVTLLKTGGLRVPAQPQVQGDPNFFLEREDPILETTLEGRRLLLQLDTGAAASQFFPPFFRAFRRRVLARGRPAKENIEGVGTQVTVPAYVIQGFSLRIAGRDVVFDRPVPVLPKATNPESEIFDGVLGVDLLAHFQALTVSYKAMRIVLE